jgi:hypothetical protein
VNSDNSKPKSNAVSSGPLGPKRDTVANNLSGRVKHDDRGNAVWEWAVATGSFGTDAVAQRLKKLDNSTLSLADDAPLSHDVVQQNPTGMVKGYSPYDSGVLEKKAAPRKKTDLRKLSEWMKLKKQASALKADKD